ncbi:MAG: hypothetical protein HIU82_20235 [Proteobacteria bacterium]|nr:hypothetical protein [Pseudomonadota bacterium]
MLKRVLYSAPLFALPFWLAAYALAIPLSSRITTGEWFPSHRNPGSWVITLPLWAIISYLLRATERHYKEEEDREIEIAQRESSERMKREDEERGRRADFIPGGASAADAGRLSRKRERGR